MNGIPYFLLGSAYSTCRVLDVCVCSVWVPCVALPSGGGSSAGSSPLCGSPVGGVLPCRVPVSRGIYSSSCLSLALTLSQLASLCSADGSTHTESNKQYRKVKHRYRPNLSPRQRPTAKARPDQAVLATSAEARGATHRARPRGLKFVVGVRYRGMFEASKGGCAGGVCFGFANVFGLKKGGLCGRGVTWVMYMYICICIYIYM